MVAPKAASDDDLLQLPDENDALKTMVVSRDELRQSSAGSSDDMLSLDLPTAPPAPSAPLIEPKPAAPNAFSSPKFNEPSSPAPSFGDTGRESPFQKPSDALASDATLVMGADKSQPENQPSPFDSKPFDNDFSSQSPYGNQENKPIPSPFQDSPPSFQTPSPSPFDAPQPSFKEPESPFGSPLESPNPSPLQPPTPFGQPESFNAPLEQSAWTPPPAPASEWQNQELGANTPFQPPAAATGQNQTLPIISLVLGILSLCCYVSPLTGLGALVTGYLGMKNANTNPTEYGGKTLAIIGMVLGGLFFLIGIAYYIFVLFLGAASFVGR
jgi:hypothetical protein